MSGMCFLESFFFFLVTCWEERLGFFFFQEKDAGAGLDSETDWKVIALSKERDILLLFFNSPYVSRDRLSDLGFVFFSMLVLTIHETKQERKKEGEI